MSKGFREQVDAIRDQKLDTSGFSHDDWVQVATTYLDEQYTELYITEAIAREAATKMNDGPTKERLVAYFKQWDDFQAEHARIAALNSKRQEETREQKEALARNSKQLVLGMVATIGEHSGPLARRPVAEDPDQLYGYYLEGKPHGLSCAPCGIPVTFMRHEVTQ